MQVINKILQKEESTMTMTMDKGSLSGNVDTPVVRMKVSNSCWYERCFCKIYALLREC